MRNIVRDINVEFKKRDANERLSKQIDRRWRRGRKRQDRLPNWNAKIILPLFPEKYIQNNVIYSAKMKQIQAVNSLIDFKNN